MLCVTTLTCKSCLRNCGVTAGPCIVLRTVMSTAVVHIHKNITVNMPWAPFCRHCISTMTKFPQEVKLLMPWNVRDSADRLSVIDGKLYLFYFWDREWNREALKLAQFVFKLILSGRWAFALMCTNAIFFLSQQIGSRQRGRELALIYDPFQPS